MKRCPECGRDYNDDSLSFCLDDGSELLFGPGSPSEPQTAILRDAEAPSEAATRQIGPRSGESPSTDETIDIRQTISAADLFSSGVKRHKLITAGLVIATLVVISGFGYGVYRFLSGPDANPAMLSAGPIDTQRLTGDGKTYDAAISRDGKFLVYSKLEGDEMSLWIKQIRTNSNVQVLEPGVFERLWGLAFTPDSEFVYFNGGGQFFGPSTVYRIPTLGGKHEKVLSNGHFVQFSPDGKNISFVRTDQVTSESGVYMAGPDGSNEQKVVSLAGERFLGTATSFSPDGKTLAVVVGDDTILPDPDEGIVLISLQDGRLTEIGRKWAMVSDVAWHPSGDSIIAVASDVDFVPGQVWEVAVPSGESRRVTNNTNGYRNVSITADGTSIVTMERYARSAVWVSPDLDPNNAKRIMPESGDTWGFSWTPDGRIVYVSDQSGDTEVWAMNADGSGAKQLTNDRIFKSVPVVSPDGRYIVYVSAEGGGELVRIDINGGNRVVIVNKIAPDNPDISRDGRTVIFSAWEKGKIAIFRTDIDGSPPVRITPFTADEPKYSLDGSYFACFALNEKTQHWDRVAILPAEGGEPISYIEMPAETSLGRGPAWTPDGKGIVVIVSPGDFQHLYLLPLDGGAPKQLTDFGSNGVARRNYSLDGKQIAIVRGEGFSNAIMISGFRQK
ncbi:MAG: hypothetical protein AB7Q37_04445 [Pyrinomonadaceae bacterium]